MPETILIRENVKNVTETGAIFVDGTEKSFDTIIYCTGKFRRCSDVEV